MRGSRLEQRRRTMCAHISKKEGVEHSEANTAASKAGGSSMKAALLLLRWCRTGASIVHRVNGRSIANAAARDAGDVKPARPADADGQCVFPCNPP